MNCPFCNREIKVMTGFQEIEKFRKHLRTCKKNPNRKTIINEWGEIEDIVKNNTFLSALHLRAKSGQ